MYIIKKLGKKHTVILSSHILSEIQAVCDHVIIINKGKIAANDTTENLTSNITTDHKLIARIDGSREEILKVIKGIPDVISVVADMERETGIFDYEIDVREGKDIRRELFKRIVARNWIMLGLKTTEMSLEDIFLKITMGDSVTIKTKSKHEEIIAAANAAVSDEASDGNQENTETENGGEQ